MGATSVTGVGRGSSYSSSEHQSIGVSHLIGPRWTAEKEETLKRMEIRLSRLWWFNILSNIAFAVMAIAYYLYTMVR